MGGNKSISVVILITVAIVAVAADHRASADFVPAVSQTPDHATPAQPQAPEQPTAPQAEPNPAVPAPPAATRPQTPMIHVVIIGVPSWQHINEYKDSLLGGDI